MDELHRALARRISMLRRQLASESSLRRGWRDYAKHMVAERDQARAALAARPDTAAPEATDEHIYLPTACLHHDHGYCGSSDGYDVQGEPFEKRPAQCKWCASPCICDCHVDSVALAARTPQPTEPQPFPMCKCGHAKIEHIERAGACRRWFTAKSMSWVCACLRYDPAEPPEGQP